MAEEKSLQMKYCMAPSYIGEFNKFIEKNKIKPITLQMINQDIMVYIMYETTNKKYKLVREKDQYDDQLIIMKNFDIIELKVDNNVEYQYNWDDNSGHTVTTYYMLVEYE